VPLLAASAESVGGVHHLLALDCQGLIAADAITDHGIRHSIWSRKPENG